MEEIENNPTEVNSVDINNVLRSRILCLNKKRKFQAEQLGLPLSKHKCPDQSYPSESNSLSNINPDARDFYTCIKKGEIDKGARDDGSEQGSGKDSNSFHGDADTVMFVSGEANTNLEYPKTCSYDQPYTSSVNWGNDCLKSALYSFESRLVTKSTGDGGESPYIGGAQNSPHSDLGFHTSLNYEEHLLEFGNHVDCSIEQYTDEEIEDMLHFNGVNSNHFVLSSGRWNVNQEAQPTTKKLTIDKEFEEYFSMLMF